MLIAIIVGGVSKSAGTGPLHAALPQGICPSLQLTYQENMNLVLDGVSSAGRRPRTHNNSNTNITINNSNTMNNNKNNSDTMSNNGALPQGRGRAGDGAIILLTFSV